MPLLILAGLIAFTLTACSSPAQREAMIPAAVRISTHHPHSVQVSVSGGSDTSALDSSNISDDDLKAALEDAITQTRLFQKVVQGSGGDYELSVRVSHVSKPMIGIALTVDIETAWSLTKRSDRSIVMRKAVNSTGSASMGDAFAFVTRLRMAVEAAARDNISQGLKAIGELTL